MNNADTFSLNSLSADEINKIEAFRKSRQTAVLVILFSDIVDSSYATEKLGEQTYSKLRHIHDELFRKIMSRDGAGIIIKEIGDSFLCVFSEPSTAVKSSIEFQSAIYSNKEHFTVQDYTLRVKIGIHIGQVAVENSLVPDIFGTHVNRAARIESLANGGQILTSQSIWENAVGWLKDNKEYKIKWVAYGKTRLKGIQEKVDIYSFYSEDMGKPATPKIFRTQKIRRTLFTSISLALLIAAALLYFTKERPENKTSTVSFLTEPGRNYYVQFDFLSTSDDINAYKEIMLEEREIKPEDISYSKSVVDSTALREELLSSIIYALSPDSVITENDLARFYINKGSFFEKEKRRNDTYYRDSLNLKGTLFIETNVSSCELKDSILLKMKFTRYFEKNIQEYLALHYYNMESIDNDIRNEIQNTLLSTRKNEIQGLVLGVKDSTVLFRLNKTSRLRTGASISFQRKLTQTSPFDSFLKKEGFFGTNKTASIKSMSLQVEGKVIELYDSIGKAIWTGDATIWGPLGVPWEGDEIFLDY